MYIHIYIYDWLTLLHSINWHNTVNQLYFKKKKVTFKKKKISSRKSYVTAVKSLWFTPSHTCAIWRFPG